MASISFRAIAAVALTSLAPLVSGLGQQQIISFNSSGSAFQITNGGQILVSPNEYWGVIRAAGDLAQDFGRVTGTNLTLSNGASGAAPAAYSYLPANVYNETFVSIPQ